MKDSKDTPKITALGRALGFAISDDLLEKFMATPEDPELRQAVINSLVFQEIFTVG